MYNVCKNKKKGLIIKVLVFGSKGMVGSSIIRSFEHCSEKFSVVPSSRQDTNLFSFDETSSLIKKISPDIIINAAARVGGIYANNTKRTEFILDNLKINMNILEACIDYPDIRIINLGSSCIYPLNAENPIKEAYFLDGKLEPTNSPYAIAKIAAIEIGSSLNIQFGHKVINLMPTNLYGPNDNFSSTSSHVIPGLIRRMFEAKIKGEDTFNIWGTGRPLREFLYVDDLSNAIRFVIDYDIPEGIYNVGSGEEISIYELSKKIKYLLKYEGKLEFNTDKPDGNPRKLLDSTKINNLGWKHNIGLDDGLEKTIKWFNENLSVVLPGRQ